MERRFRIVQGVNTRQKAAEKIAPSFRALTIRGRTPALLSVTGSTCGRSSASPTSVRPIAARTIRYRAETSTAIPAMIPVAAQSLTGTLQVSA